MIARHIYSARSASHSCASEACHPLMLTTTWTPPASIQTALEAARSARKGGDVETPRDVNGHVATLREYTWGSYAIMRLANETPAYRLASATYWTPMNQSADLPAQAYLALLHDVAEWGIPTLISQGRAGGVGTMSLRATWIGNAELLRTWVGGEKHRSGGFVGNDLTLPQVVERAAKALEKPHAL
jgi:hypothetical protein